MSTQPLVPYEDKDNFGSPPGAIFAALRLYADSKGGVHVRGRYMDHNGQWQTATSYIDYALPSATLYGFGLDLDPDE